MTSADQIRRKVLGIGLAAPALFLMSCADQPKKPEPISVDVSDVKDVPSLIRAMKTAAGNLLPNNIKDKDFYSEFARIFVENARAAADKGYPIPKWVLDKLPQRKVIFPFLGVVTFPIWGVYYTVAVGAIVEAVIWSIVFMTVEILTVLATYVPDSPKKM